MIRMHGDTIIATKVLAQNYADVGLGDVNWSVTAHLKSDTSPTSCCALFFLGAASSSRKRAYQTRSRSTHCVSWMSIAGC